jgi:hypothetical protein
MHGNHRHSHGHSQGRDHGYEGPGHNHGEERPSNRRMDPGFRREGALGTDGPMVNRFPGESRGPYERSHKRNSIHEHRHANHDHPHPGRGHNLPFGDLNSHLAGHDERNRYRELQSLAAAFIDAFQKADDKQSYLRLAGIPASLPGPDGLEQFLVDVAILAEYQVATASPGFASRELVHLPFPGSMVKERTKMTFAYVSLTGRSDVDLLDILDARFPAEAVPPSQP